MAEMEKLALLVAYCGAGYKGMQRNPGAVTIERDLEEALVRAGAIGSAGYSKKWLDWKRAARTDKEVSAAGQVVSGRFYPIDNFVEHVNSELPPAIRLLAMKHVPDSFNAKKLCSCRRYEYVLPTFALNPSVHRGKLNEPRLERLEKSEEFVFDEEKADEFNRILSRFQGTRNFHNFTWRVGAEDGERTVMSFTAEKEVVLIQGMEFVRIVILGRSFMLYQIRKMVGLAVSVMRKVAEVEVIDSALRCDLDVVVPTAPELGLLLDECLYDEDHQHGSFEESRKMMREFKVNVVYPHIGSSELKNKTVERWLPSLNPRNYPVFRSTLSQVEFKVKI